MIQIAGTRASILRLRRDAQETKVAHFAPERAKISADQQEVSFVDQHLFFISNLLEVIQLINFFGMWRELLLKEVKGDFSQLLALLTQAVHGIVDGIMRK